jgi:hypothetical protein
MVMFLAATGSAAAETVVVVAARDRIVIANGGMQKIEIRDRSTGQRVWTGAGPADPSLAVAAPDGNRAAVIDGAAGTVDLVDTARPSGLRLRTGGSPTAARFLGETLFVVLRDESRLAAIARDGTLRFAGIGRDSTFLAEHRGDILVYSRAEGTIARFDPATMVKKGEAHVAAYASDLETDGTMGYLVVPSSAAVVAFRLDDFRVTERLSIGAVPIDLAIQGNVLAVADPSSKRIWRTEKTQSVASAFGRGFVRGLLGLGLKPPAHSSFPTGIDRIWSDGARAAAYDSSSGTLYDVSGQPRPIASGIPAGAVAVVNGTVHFWDPAAGELRSVPLQR